MEGLSSSQLKSYLKNVKDLEVECYQLRKLSNELTYQMSNITQQSNSLNSKNPYKLVKSDAGNYFHNAVVEAWWGFLLGAICGFTVWIIVWIIRYFIECGGVHLLNIILLPFSMIKRLLFSDLVFGDFVPCLLFATVGALIGIIIGAACSINRMKQSEKNLPTLQEYNHNRAIRVAKNNKTVEALRLSQKTCTGKYQETKNILEKYYALNYIYPKYRGLVPICMFYEYFDSGRCTALQGHEGAYNLYESELRMNMIIGKLDEIIYRLDEISSNQRVLAQELRASNTKIERVMRSMASSLDSIQQSSAMTEYYSGITAANTSFMKWYTILNNKGGVLPL